MEFLIIIGIILFCATMAQKISTPNSIRYAKKSQCPPHKWEYVNNFLRCSECNRAPGYSGRE